MEKQRCFWVTNDQIYIDYHDNEWGKPVFDDETLFEFLILESFQAGLSWLTILKRRENFRQAFDHFDVQKVADYTNEKVDELLQNDSIIRHRGKIEAAISNAKLFIEIQNKYGSFSKFIWRYVNNQPIVSHYKMKKEVPVTTPLSNQIAKDLKKIGFKFFGSTTIYAFLQAIGIVNDHTVNCFCHNG